MRRFAAILAAMALAGQAHAQTPVKPCWDAPAIGAARVSEFQTLLMVVSLRCNSVGIDLRDHYDRFAAVHKSSLSAAHDLLKARFGGAKPLVAKAQKAKGDREGGKGGGDYDRFLTGVANFYGVGQTEAGVCRKFELVLGELGKASATADFLASIVMEMVRDPHLDSVRCGVQTVAK